MRRFNVGRVTLAASVAVLMLTGSAVAATHSASTTTSLSMTCVPLLPCFDLYDDDVISVSNADLMTAAAFCGVPPSQLLMVPLGTWVGCPNGRKIRRVECAVRNRLAADALRGQAHVVSSRSARV